MTDDSMSKKAREVVSSSLPRLVKAEGEDAICTAGDRIRIAIRNAGSMLHYYRVAINMRHLWSDYRVGHAVEGAQL